MSGWLVRGAVLAVQLALLWGVNGIVRAATPAVVGGVEHTVALRSDGTLWTWGNDRYGQLGQGRLTQSSTAIATQGLPSVSAIVCGSRHNLALGRDGTVWSWGANALGQLGDGGTNDRNVPVQVPGLVGVTGLAAGYAHSLALGKDGTVWAWGSNSSGQLGDGSTTDRKVPVRVSGLSGIVEIVAGMGYSLARKSDGTVWAWGNNKHGQLGDGYLQNRTNPTQVIWLTGAVGIAAGGAPVDLMADGSVQTDAGFVLARKSDGTVWAWGTNYFGQMGAGIPTAYSLPPGPVAGLTNVTSVAAGFAHGMARRGDGSVWAWGRNNYGQIGDGSTTDRALPVQVPGFSDIVAVSAGGGHSLAPPTGPWRFR